MLCQVWREVESSLTLREVKPIAADALLLQAFVDHSYNTAQKVRHTPEYGLSVCSM